MIDMRLRLAYWPASAHPTQGQDASLAPPKVTVHAVSWTPPPMSVDGVQQAQTPSPA
jgi:hypothetical protein